ncbi:hypothetical protein [Corynebacterium glyciniphilum]|uniref:hypothetical protein n=1 Tax=Corynebacterium glyciniphilum TaxID=1404244 RepID=UPI0011AB63F2|nr:hypothetical protein [Corynebacterium glyciniphilum]
MTTPSYADHVPPSPTAQQALVDARHGTPATGSTKIGLVSRRLVTEDGQPTDLGRQVAVHIETRWAANREHWG